MNEHESCRFAVKDCVPGMRDPLQRVPVLPRLLVLINITYTHVLIYTCVSAYDIYRVRIHINICGYKYDDVREQNGLKR